MSWGMRGFSTQVDEKDLLLTDSELEDTDDKRESAAEQLKRALDRIKEVQRGEIHYICDGATPMDV